MEDSKTRKIHRSRSNRMIAGVAGGLGEYFDIDPVLFRVGFVVLAFLHGIGILIYIILALIMPKEKYMEKEGNENSENSFRENPGKWEERGMREERRFFSLKDFLAIVMIFVGLVFLINAFYPIEFLKWSFIWPAILVLGGFFLIFRR